jgi:Cu2+-containing amine oxidase
MRIPSLFLAAALRPNTSMWPCTTSFTLDGQEVSWQNWKFHFRIDPRRGIVLSLVRYSDGASSLSGSTSMWTAPPTR